jgi:hypothetical protein
MRAKKFLLLLIALYTFLILPVVPDLILANETALDQSSPVIQHEPLNQAAPVGKALKIEATIRDKVGIKDATVFYRKLGEEKYQEIKMESHGNELYSATIPKEAVKEPGLEYYIQATDISGNIVMRGFSFSPLSVTVMQGVIVPEQGKSLVLTPSPEERNTMKSEAGAVEEETPWYKKWWIWAIVGAVVVGAAAAGGHGGSSSPGPQPTGTVTINGPTP